MNVRWFIGLIISPFAILLLVKRSYYSAIAVSLLSVYFLLPGIQLYIDPSNTMSKEGKRIRVASVNLLHSNADPRPFDSWLKKEKPDLLVALEIPSMWEILLKSYTKEYPYQKFIPAKPTSWKIHPWKMGILSKYPLNGFVSHSMGPDAIPWAETVIDLHGLNLRIIALHAMPPIDQKHLKLRNQVFQKVADKTRGESIVMVMGDFNATVHSPAFQELIQSAELKNASAGFGRIPSWRPLPRFGFLALDLDHILVHPCIHVKEMHSGPDIGSDHKPLVAEIVLPQS